MKAITIWQPWASWITLGIKALETRTHGRFAFLMGQRIGIHAGKQFDETAIDIAAHFRPEIRAEHERQLAAGGYPAGVLLCTAWVYDDGPCLTVDATEALCDTTCAYGLYLDKIKPFDPPVPMRGYQGAWELPREVAWAIEHGLTLPGVPA